MLRFREIKEDAIAGLVYYEYETQKYKGYNVTPILDGDNVIYCVTSETHQVTIRLDKNDFLKMSYSRLIKIVMTHIYYNMVEKLEG